MVKYTCKLFIFHVNSNILTIESLYMVLTILQEYNIHPENCLYVGDSEVDIETAANAGIACVSVPWGFRDREFLIQHGASIMIHTPDALTQYILAPNKQGASR